MQFRVFVNLLKSTSVLYTLNLGPDASRTVCLARMKALGLIQMIVSGETLPELTTKAIDQGNVKHAEEHADCTRDEVLGYLNKNSAAIAAYLAGLDNEDLDRYSKFITG